MATTNLTLYGSNARQIKPAVVNTFQNNNNVDRLEFTMENYNQDNVDLSTLDAYAICFGSSFGLDEIKLESEVTEDGVLRIYWDLTLMTLGVSQAISYQIVFKNDDGDVWTSYKAIIFCNESLTADEEIVAQYPTILRQIESRIVTIAEEASGEVADELMANMGTEVDNVVQYINNMAGAFDAAVVYIPYGETIPVEQRVNNRLYYQYTNADQTKGRFEDWEGTVLISESSGGGGGGLPMFAPIWSDHLYNDASYLRADTFSWHYASIYVSAYKKLLEQYNHKNSVEKTENGVTYKLTPDGFKIADGSQHDNIRIAYENNGVAWFYLLDTENERFKLPREKAELVTNYPSTASVDVAVVGNGMTLGMTDGAINAGVTIASNDEMRLEKNAYGTNIGTVSSQSYPASSNFTCYGITTDPTKSGLVGSGTADLSKITTERVNTEGKRYLYFYVGNYERPETEVNIGILTELANGTDISVIVEEINEIKNQAIAEVASYKQPLTTLTETSGTVTLEVDKIYSIAIDGVTTFSLPTEVDTAYFNQIKVMVQITGTPTITWGTDYFVNKSTPELEEGCYDFYFDYDNNLAGWVVGVVSKGLAE